MLIDSVGQDTVGMANLCSVISAVLARTTPRLGAGILQRRLARGLGCHKDWDRD